MDALNVGKLNSYFGEGIILKGKLKFKGILRLDGDFEGDITSGDSFIVGKSGRVRGNTKTKNLFNFGGIVGKVEAANKISLHADSSLKGNIKTPFLVVEQWSYFEGACEMPLEKRPQRENAGKMELATVSASAPSMKSNYNADIKSTNEIFTAKKTIMAGLVILVLVIGWFSLGGDSGKQIENEVDMATPTIIEDDSKALLPPDETVKVADKTPEKSEKEVDAPPVKGEVVVLDEKEKLRLEIKNNPKDPQPRLKLAVQILKEDDYKKALLALEEAVRAFPRNKDIRLLIAETYQTVGRESAARKQFVVLGEIDSGSVSAQNNDAYDLMEKGALDRAVSLFQDVLRNDPENKRARLGLATVYSKLEQNDRAAQECLRILEKSKNYAPAMNRLAWIYAKQGVKLLKARVLSERSIRVFSEIPEYLDTLSEINFKMGKYDKAIEIIKRAISLAPNESYYERQLFKFERAKNRSG